MGRGIITFVPMMIYVAAVVQIVPFYVDRYVMCTYPLWCLLTVLGIRSAVELLTECKRIGNRICEKKTEYCRFILFSAGIMILIFINNGFMHKPGYLGENGQETYTVPENTNCVYVLPDGTWNESAEDTLILSKCTQVAVVYCSQLPCLKDTYEHQEGDHLLVVVSKSLDEKAVLAEVKNGLGVEDMQKYLQEEAYNTNRLYYR